MKKQFLKQLILFLFIGFLLRFGAAAANESFVAYNTYEYNYFGESVTAPVGYYPLAQMSGIDMGLDIPLDAPTDLYNDGNGGLYLLDSKNSRILRLDYDLKIQKIYNNFIIPAEISPNGIEEKADFTDARGFVVDQNKSFYIADTKNRRVLLSREDGRIYKLIDKGQISALDADAQFDVSKIILGNDNDFYVIAESINKGAMIFTKEGNFVKFFGSNPVFASFDAILKYARRKFMSEIQLQRSIQYTPVNIAGFDMDGEGFVYTVIKGNARATTGGTVRKLNFKGRDILNQYVSKELGDLEWDRAVRSDNSTKFIDIDVDSDGFINLIDSTRGRIFQYAPQADTLIAVFGAYGSQLGTFAKPSSLETVGDRVYVADEERNTVTIFVPTDYAKNFRSAVLRIAENDTGGSRQYLKKMMEINDNNEYSYYGLGKISDMEGDYKQAMKYFKLANARSLYSISFKEYRKIFVHDNLLLILGITLVSLLILGICLKLIKKRLLSGNSVYSVMESRFLMPFYTTIHPVDGFEQFKNRKIQSAFVSAVIITIWFCLNVMQFFITGFTFNIHRAVDFNLFNALVQTFGIFILFVVANWAVCTLLDGKGRLSEIIGVTAYSLLPYLFSIVLCVLFSNVLTQNEGAFLTLFSAIGKLWTGLVLFCGLYTIHQYSVRKTAVSLIFTVAGMAVIIFLLVLFYSLLSQAFGFIQALIQEVSLRG